ncbi:MAG: MFS transporter [Oscillospiraceae bacterium]|nr:MFS transporter [Oscillospiraceae bacterium]
MKEKKKRLSFKKLLSEKAFMRLVIANTVNRFGDSISFITFQWIVFLITGSPVWIAVVLGINFLPNILFQPFFAVLVERMNKKQIMAICDFGRASVILTLLVMFHLELVTPALLMIFAFTNSTFESFRIPAGISLRPKILPKEKFTTGIALDSSVGNISELIGFGIAGVLITISPVVALVVDFSAFILSAIAVLSIPYSEENTDRERLTVKSYFSAFSGGLKYFKLNKAVLFLALFGAAINIPITPILSFQAIYVADYLFLGAAALSFINIASTLGRSLGAAISPKVRSFLKPVHIFLVSGAGIAMVYIAIAFLPSLVLGYMMIMALLTGIMFVFGIFDGVSMVVYSTTFYASIDDDFVSRVSGIFNATATATIPLAQFLFAFIASFASITTIFIIGAVMSVVIYTAFSIPKVIRNLGA